jgi:serine protease
MTKFSPSKATLCAALLTFSAFGVRTLAPVHAQTQQPKSLGVAGFIVQFREQSAVEASAFDSSARADALERATRAMSARTGVDIQYKRAMSGGYEVFSLAKSVDDTRAQQLAEQIAASPDVESVTPDAFMRRTVMPNDTFFNNDDMWHLMNPVDGIYGINAEAAWDIEKGSPKLNVAVLDGGILKTHPDLASRFVGGYDMVSSIPQAPDLPADGGGRDADASDPGDFVTAAEAADPESLWRECDTESSWHGSHVAGTIGAAVNNGEGISGINWESKIVPVRVLGKCGTGITSDIVDGMRWAVGLDVLGVPRNPNPVRVLNMSLGGSGPCSAAAPAVPIYQNAINEIVRGGGIVVVAAGNENLDVSTSRPANCANVIAVAATTKTGNRAFYSNFGNGVTIAAPGGDTRVGDGVLSSVNAGLTTPTTSTYKEFQGTSMATPHVVGIVSLMLSHRNYLNHASVVQILKNTATAFPASSTCLSSPGKTCGAGIANAGAALAYVDTLPVLTRTLYLPLTRK